MISVRGGKPLLCRAPLAALALALGSGAFADGGFPPTPASVVESYIENGIGAVNDYLFPPRPSYPRCHDSEEGEPPAGLLAGARRVFVEMYQSCHVLDVPPLRIPPGKVADGVDELNTDSRGSYTFRRLSDPQKYRDTNPYLMNYPATPIVLQGCVDPLLRPPIYGYGARPSVATLSTGARAVSLHGDRTREGSCLAAGSIAGSRGIGRNGVVCSGLDAEKKQVSSPVQALDCAGFVQAAFMMQGLRIKPDQDIRVGYDGTTAFRAAGDDPKSCLGKVMFTPGGRPFEPGDLLVTSGAHITVVDSVGSDPLGIETVEDCSELSPLHFNFTILQSSPFGGGIGVQRTEGSSFYNSTSEHATQFLAIARSYCEMAKSAERGEGPPFIGAPGSVLPASSERSAILRHKGNVPSGCMNPEQKMKPVDSCPGLDDCDYSRTGRPQFGSTGAFAVGGGRKA